jgi:glycosyltransferase 2 family protein
MSRGDPRGPAEVLWEETRSASPSGLVLSGILYLVGFGFAAAFWIRLTRSLGGSLPVAPAVRGYYLSQLGKYAPGKGWALILRLTAAAEAGCSPGLAVLTAVYETLTTMAVGALLAALLLLVQDTHDANMLWKALALLALAGLPILPGVFNRLVGRLTRRFIKDPASVPRVQGRSLVGGVLLTLFFWIFLGLSLEVLLLSLADAGPPSVSGLVRSMTFIAVSYVAGFIASTPGGLGVREFLLQQMLAPQLGARAVVVALLLRLIWTLAEVVMAAVVWWLPSKRTEDRGQRTEDREQTMVDNARPRSTVVNASPIPDP